MEPPEVARRVGVGLLVFTLVVAGGIVTAGGTGADTPTFERMTYEAYAGDGAVAPVPQGSGEVSMSADATGTVVLIDASHRNAIDRQQLTPLVEALTRNGAEVRFLPAERRGPRGPGAESAFNASLRRADAFVTFGPERQYADRQVDGIEAFAAAGGRVLVVKEPAQMRAGLILFGYPRSPGSPAVPLTSLGSRFGVSFGNGYLYNMHSYDTNYRNVYATPANAGPLTEGVDRLVLHEATPVHGPNTVLSTTDRTELSETREPGRYGVVVRSGNVTAVGDSSVFDQAYYRRADNEVFVGNVLDFLVSGDKVPANAPAPPEPEEGDRPRR